MRTVAEREKIRSTPKIFRFAKSIKTIAFFEIFKKNKNILGGLIYVLLKPFILTMILFLFISTIRRGYSIEEGVNQFLMPIALYYFVLDFIGGTNFYDAGRNYKFLPNVSDLSILFGKVLEVLIINYSVILLVIIFIYFIGLSVNLPSLMYLFSTSLIFGMTYFFAFTILFSNNQSMKELHSYIPRFLLFFSCVIFPLSIFPPEIQEILLWNPLVHISEFARLSLDQNILINKPNFLSLSYPAYCIAMFAIIFMLTYIIKIQILRYRKNIRDFF